MRHVFLARDRSRRIAPAVVVFDLSSIDYKLMEFIHGVLSHRELSRLVTQRTVANAHAQNAAI